MSGFNSSVGILSVGTNRLIASELAKFSVSIPQSEFCPLGPMLGDVMALMCVGFNSSVGILSVGTKTDNRTRAMLFKFQFLSRNSVRWDAFGFDGANEPEDVSIPQSEFCPLGLSGEQCTDGWLGSFNSSVGILSVGTGNAYQAD